MPAIPEAVQKAWENREDAIVLTTVDTQGIPNAIYATCVRLQNEETIVVADNFFHKTRANILAGSKASLLFITKEGKSYQVKGRVTYHTSGAIFDAMKGWNPEHLPGVAAAALTIESIYSGAEQLA